MIESSVPVAEVTITNIRQVMNPLRGVYSAFVHVQAPDQTTIFEYCNMSTGPQKVIAALLTPEGDVLKSVPPRTFPLEPQATLSMNCGEWFKEAGMDQFTGQILIFVERPAKYTGPDIPPAITGTWSSTHHCCMIASQAFPHVNIKAWARKKSFYMFCPVIVCDESKTTLITLSNHSTEADYTDSIQITPVLSGSDGAALEGESVTIPPFGMMILDVSKHFRGSAEKFIAQHAGKVSLSVAHVGHIMPCYFFYSDRKTHAIVAGQHTQPPSSILHYRRGVWWGRLRQYSPF